MMTEIPDEMKKESFKGCSIVSCGTLRPELAYLEGNGLLDADGIFYTAPGLHENNRELKVQLAQQIARACRRSAGIIVIYGKRCYLDFRKPFRTIDTLIADTGVQAARIDAANCIDMLADDAQREHLAGGARVYWLTLGWLLYWRAVFRDWDKGKANETFPAHDRAVVLDPSDGFAEHSEQNPEEVLEFSDWMGIPIEAQPVSWTRFGSLLLQARNTVTNSEVCGAAAGENRAGR